MKNILITHTDLDGAGCAIIFKNKYPDIEIQYHDYKSITEVSKWLLKNQDNYEHIYFADISPEKEEGTEMLKNNKFTIIDHHKTRIYLEGTKHFNTKYCGAYLATNFLFANSSRKMGNTTILNFINKIDAWDSWKLDSLHRKKGEELNLLFGYYGMDQFVREFHDMRNLFSQERIIIEALKKLKEDYLKHKIRQAKIKIDNDNNKYWELYIGEPQSGLGNLLEMADNFNILPDIKYLECINLNDGVVSLYTINKLNFDVSELAKERGGGGHKNASGYTIIN